MPSPSTPTPFIVPKHPVIPPSPVVPAKPSGQKPQIIRRRPNQQQGRALEILGHAIEYLIDSRMFLIDEPHTSAESDAVKILSRCSREVFNACEEILPVHQRFRNWAAERLATLQPDTRKA